MRNIERLIAFIEARLNKPHDFRDNDCVRFVLGAVEAQYGYNVRLGVNWSTERGAKRAIARLGGMRSAADEHFNQIRMDRAAFGDIAGVNDPATGFHVMLIEGQSLIAPGERGVMRLPRTEMICAWSSLPKAMIHE